MPTRIPVQIAEHQFSSINQARRYYTDILHRHKEGGCLQEKDAADVFSLMASSRSTYPTDQAAICVTKGYFARNCFASVGPDGKQHYVSIILSLKKCVEPPAVKEPVMH